MRYIIIGPSPMIMQSMRLGCSHAMQRGDDYKSPCMQSTYISNSIMECLSGIDLVQEFDMFMH